MNISKEIGKLIKTNIKIWHKDAVVRNEEEKGVGVSKEEKGRIFLEARILNSERSDIRFGIDSFFKCGTCDTKLNYFKG